MKLFAVQPVGVSLIQAVDYLLNRSIESYLKNQRCLNLIGPIKFNWIPWFVFSTDGK